MAPVPLLPRYYEVLRTPAAHLAALRFPSLGNTIPCACVRSSRKPDAGLRPGVVLVGNPEPISFGMETTGTPRFLGNPCVSMPCSPTPAGPAHQAIRCTVAVSVVPITKTPSKRLFRGSITRLRHLLSTLRPVGLPTGRKTRFRSLAKLSRTGLVTRRVPTKGFSMYPYIASSFPKLSWRKGTPLGPGSTRKRRLNSG